MSIVSVKPTWGRAKVGCRGVVVAIAVEPEPRTSPVVANGDRDRTTKVEDPGNTGLAVTPGSVVPGLINMLAPPLGAVTKIGLLPPREVREGGGEVPAGSTITGLLGVVAGWCLVVVE
jgi:hypothetical protein